MGYLNSSTVSVDAILTKQGRKMLAQGQGLNITKFALGDTGVDYKLYNPDHPKGSSFYGEAITNSPQLEACTADHTNLRYTLMTWDRDKAFIPKIVVDKNDKVVKKSTEINPETHAEFISYTHEYEYLKMLKKFKE